MRHLREISGANFQSLTRRGELGLKIGPYNFRLQSNIPGVIEGVRTLYADFPTPGPDDFVDYHVGMRYPGLVARLRRRADFYFDYQRPFAAVKSSQAYASLEWGMNWCVSIYANEFLKLHAGVVARNGNAIVMPGVPGAGKSTLCAALALSGWRVLSDEHAMFAPGSTSVVPLCRPVSLKNESIPVIRSFDSKAIIGPVSADTHKGTVAHLKADLVPDSHETDHLPARIMLFPRFSRDEAQRLSTRKRTDSFMLAAYHSFNYSVLGKEGFQTMKNLLDAVQCYDLVYHDLDWALTMIEELHKRDCPA